MSSVMYVRVKTLDCPRCGKSDTVLMSRAEFDDLRESKHAIQKTLARFNPGVRERFISGYCPECWDIVFPEEDDGEEPGGEGA